MFKPIAISPSIILFAVLGTLLAFLYLFFRNLRKTNLRKHYEAAILSLKDELKRKDDELDLLFVQLLQWREYTEEYRNLLRGILPLVENNSTTNVLTDLEQRFEHLYHLTETERKKYMEKMTQHEDYSADYKKVIDHVVNKMVGMNTGMKAEETPILNQNRDN